MNEEMSEITPSHHGEYQQLTCRLNLLGERKSVFSNRVTLSLSTTLGQTSHSGVVD